MVKKKGEGVLGGTILIQGHLTYRVTASQADSALQRIIEMVERDIGHKSVYVRAADQIVRWFVPAVILIAAAVAGGYWLFPAASDTNPAETAWLRAMAVLLISCPCAIGIAAPTAESHLLNSLAALGIIVRNRGCLPHLGNESVIVFDKTGTVTEGRYTVRERVDQIAPADRQALYSLASQSIHPVACAVAGALCDEKVLPLEHLEEIVGLGLRGMVNGCTYVLGSERLMRQEGIALPEMYIPDESEILSYVYYARDNHYLTCLLLGDRVREDMRTVVAALNPTQTVLLSGDSKEAVASVAKLCGFDQWHSACSPLEKREFIEKLKAEGKIVCMVGDGINDAPALTSAHIGISVVSATDMSIQVSDVLLTTNTLSVIVKMRSLARKGQRIVRQNLFWAFFYNVIGIILAAFGVLSPIFAAFAMSISSLTVLFNARRLS